MAVNREWHEKNKDAVSDYQKRWLAKNREHHSRWGKNWYAANKDHHNAKSREWYAANKDRHNARASRWARENSERKLEMAKRWRTRNPEKAKALGQRWRKQNPHVIREQAMRRYAAERHATPRWLTAEHKRQILDFYESACLLSALTGEMFHVDHIVPLRGKHVCGLHVPWNLQILTMAENIKKGNRYP